jgi:DNA-binding MarR family transcriptional regulator
MTNPPPLGTCGVTRGPDPAVSVRDVLSFFVESPDPAFTARELADEFDKTRQWADNRLKQLEDDDLLASKNPGGRARFYWITIAGEQYLAETRDPD